MYINRRNVKEALTSEELQIFNLLISKINGYTEKSYDEQNVIRSIQSKYFD